MPGLSNCVVYFVTPDDFEGKFNTLWGSGFSIAPLFRQSAWFRFHNQSEELENLYFCGAGTHPGAGVPGVVSSAKVVERLVPPCRMGEDDSFGELFRSKSRTFFPSLDAFTKGKSQCNFRLYYVCRTLDDWADEGQGTPS